MTEEWADRIALGIVGLTTIVLVVNLILALAVSAPDPAPTQDTCTESDRACLEWDDIRESEWRTD